MAPGNVAKSVAVVFFGGPDDREALTVARRIAEHPGVTLTVIRMKATKEAELGFAVMQETETQQEQLQPTGAAAAAAAAAGGVVTAAAQGLMGTLHSVTGRKGEDEGGPEAASFIVPVSKMERDREAELDGEALALVIALSNAGKLPAEGSRQADSDIGDAENVDSGEVVSRSGNLSVIGSVKSTRSRGVVKYEEKELEDPVAAVSLLADSNNFDLVVVGRGRRTTPLVAQIAAQRTPFRSYFSHHVGKGMGGADAGTSTGGAGIQFHEGSELGPVGELFATSESRCSVLVVQQFDPHLMKSLRGQGTVVASETLEGTSDSSTSTDAPVPGLKDALKLTS